jgi:succinate dehydrogenase/fumarate reductase flavoprotein subunit
MRYKGEFEFAGHAIPGEDFFFMIKYSGQNQKPILTREARNRTVQIVNRVMIYDLLYDNGVIGAIGVDTREDKIVIIKAKSVILSTGLCGRLYPSPTPGWMFNRADSPHTTGDGRAMAYRAGAELINMELVHRWAGPKYFSRCGKGTWVGVFRDPQGKPVGPFVTKPDRKYGDSISDVYTSLFEDFVKSGKGPVYMDCRGMTDEDHDYMIYWLKHEGNCALVDHLSEEGVDLRKNPVEFMTYEMSTRGGIHFNERGETTLKGVYAAGDEYFGSGAATFGWISGEHAANFAQQRKAPDLNKAQDTIKQDRALFESIRNREVGAGWQEVNTAVNQVMFDYAGTVRYESLLEAGLAHLHRIRQKASGSLMAGNAHELMHCLEVVNIMDIGELVFTAVRDHKETREKYSRIDHPFRNPVLDGKTLFCKKGKRGPITQWKMIQ